MRGNSHVRFGSGEKVEITSKPYLSTSAAYAVIGYQTAFLMRYYPVEFIAAMLNSFIGSAAKASFYIRYAKSIGIELLPPDINESRARFTVSGNKIRFGLAGIKNLGFNVIDTIIRTREKKGKFTSFHDFISKLDEAGLNKRACECMIKAGAFDSMGVERSRLLAVYERILESFSSERKRLIKGQLSFFGTEAGDGTEDMDGFAIKLPQIEEFPLKDRLFMEKEMTGLYLTGHPLDEYAEELAAISTIQVQDIIDDDLLDDVRDEATLLVENQMKAPDALRDGQRVTMGGILTTVTRKITRNNAMMAFVTMEDPTGDVEIIVFPKTYELIKAFLKEDLVVAVSGRLQMRDDENTKIIAEEMQLIEKGKLPQFKMGSSTSRFHSVLKPHPTLIPQSTQSSPPIAKARVPQSTDKLYLRFHHLQEAKAILGALEGLFKAHQGETPVVIYAAEEKQSFQLSERQRVNCNSNIVELLEQKLGRENVVLK